MPSTDITYCIRECGNMECKRNKANLPETFGFFWQSDFKDCKEWRKKNGKDKV